jgi:hypothetical protein
MKSCAAEANLRSDGTNTHSFKVILRAKSGAHIFIGNRHDWLRLHWPGG